MHYISILLLLLSLTLGGCAQNTARQADDSALGITGLRQTVAADNTAARTIMWQSGEAKDFTLEYKEKERSDVRRITAQPADFTENAAVHHQYRVQLSDLQPGTEYEYRIADKNATGTWHKLKTADTKAFSALIFPDSQSSDYAGWQKLAADAYKKNPQADLYISMGDLVDNGADYRQWQEWFKGINTFAPDIPLAAVLGNHETYTMDWKTQLPHIYTNLFTFPANGSDKYQNRFYSFDYGPVHFIVLDTQFAELKDLQPQLAADEISWLKNDLAASQSRWKVVLQHKDILLYEFNNRPNTATHFIDIGEMLMPVFEEYNVDLVLTAHLHTYRRRVPLKNFKPDDSGITYILTGIAGNVMYPGLWKHSDLDAAAGPDGDRTNYLTLDADENKLIVKAFLADGTEFDNVELRK